MRWRVHTGLLLLPGELWGHTGDGGAGTAWSADPWVLGPLLLGLLGYAWGAWCLRRQTTNPRLGLRHICFGTGMLALWSALVWPLEAWSDRSFAAHMVQHLLLLSIAPPLLVLARPLPLYLLALPAGFRRLLLQRLRGRARAGWRLFTRPGVAFVLHGVTLWAWHAPILFDAALDSRALHILEHLTFLCTALLFWWSLFNVPRLRARGYGISAFWLLSTLMHSGLLGALLTFAPRPLYPHYASRFAAGDGPWGLSLMEDQQLAGVIMWVPAGLIYLAAGLILLGLFLRHLERAPPPKPSTWPLPKQ